YEVAGRGELQLGVLVETMRREGYELAISRPRVLFRNDPDTGQRLEPMEEVQVDVDDDFVGVVVEKIGRRRGEMTGMRASGGGKTRAPPAAPPRGVLGSHGEFSTNRGGGATRPRLSHG